MQKVDFDNLFKNKANITITINKKLNRYKKNFFVIYLYNDNKSF